MIKSWYAFAFMALFFLGFQRFLYKVSAERKCNTALTTFSFMATVALLASILFLVQKESLPNLSYLLFIAFINSSAFLIGTVTHIESLKFVPAHTAYTIIRLNLVLVVVFSIFFFKDHLSLFQVMGIILSLTVIIILTKQTNEELRSEQRKRGLIYVFVSLLSSVVATISSKFAAVNTNILAFMATSYIFATLFSLGLSNKFAKEVTTAHPKEALSIGVLMGLFNFVGFYMYLKALSTGPLSIVATLMGMHFVIAIILSAIIYKEKLTTQAILGISLAIVAVVFLRL
jgi:drug/metabolite transporter (DMT)-like permease